MIDVSYVYKPHASNEVMAAANASTGASGAMQSKLYLCLRLFPNCRRTSSPLFAGSTSWKLRTLACLTRSVKLPSYRPWTGFQRGALVANVFKPCHLPARRASRRPDASLELVGVGVCTLLPFSSKPRVTTVSLRGQSPRRLRSYVIAASSTGGTPFE